MNKKVKDNPVIYIKIGIKNEMFLTPKIVVK